MQPSPFVDISLQGRSIIHIRIKEAEKSQKDLLEMAEHMESGVLGIMSQKPLEDYMLLIEMDPEVKSLHANARQRQAYSRLCSHKQITRVAVVTDDEFITMLVMYFAKTLDKEASTKVFPDKKQALAWLGA